MFEQVNGISLFYERSGSGRPLLMVHGNGETRRVFDEAAAALSGRFDVIRPDSRCHGLSEDTPELHYSDMADDMIALIEKLDLHDVVFYGFSDGGIVGLLAAERCERITALITSGANTSPDAVKAWLKRIIRVSHFFTRDKKLALMLREPHISDAELEKIRIPALILAGSEDVIPEEETRHIAAKIPGAQLKILPGEGHGSYIKHSTKIAELIADFCAPAAC